MIFALDTNIISFILRGNSDIILRIRQEELRGNNVKHFDGVSKLIFEDWSV